MTTEHLQGKTFPTGRRKSRGNGNTERSLARPEAEQGQPAMESCTHDAATAGRPLFDDGSLTN